MPADFTDLNAAVNEAAAQADKTEGTEASAIVVINAQGAATEAAVTKALEADNAADQGSISAAIQAIRSVTSRFAASGAKLGDAVASHPV